MALNEPTNVDAIGIENETGKIVMTILDAETWDDPEQHLLALQTKINAYFDFVEGQELQLIYPSAKTSAVVIDVITRYPLHPKGAELLLLAAKASEDLDVEIRHRHAPTAGSGP